jgi:hypothetical protein
MVARQPRKTTAADGRIAGAAFYCVSSGMYFLGAVGMINSLRLQSHTEPIFVLDRGLSSAQRELLEPQASVVGAPDDRDPFMLKALLPARYPAEVRVLIDADMIATRSLAGLIETAAEGRVVAVEHPHDRFVPEWGELLGLGRARRHRYLSSGLVFLGGSAGSEVIRLMEEKLDAIDFDRTQFRTLFPDYPFIDDAPVDAPDYPFLFADQDLLNAILATRVRPERIVALQDRLAPIPPFERLRVLDERRLRCADPEGTEPYVLHHYLSKPWLEPTHHGVYSRLLRRLLVGPDLAVRVPESELPLRFRSGPLALAERTRINARERIRYHLAEPLASRLRALRDRPGRACR